jgi:hypothetical protein
MEEELIDTSWIDKYDNEEKKYDIYYKEENTSIKTTIIYINNNMEIEQIKEQKIKIIDNIIKKEDFLKIIKDSQNNDNKKYSLINILIYNFDIENTELENFLTKSEKYNIMKKINYLQDYTLSSTIKYLQDINNLYILLIEKNKNKPKCNTTKRVRFNILQSKTKKRKPKY